MMLLLYASKNNLEIIQHRRATKSRTKDRDSRIERNYRDTPFSPQPASSQFTF